MERLSWRNVGPKLTPQDVRDFEGRHRVRLAPAHADFLCSIINGGSPVSNTLVVPTVDCPGGAACLHGIFGIGHPESFLNLAAEIGADAPFLPRYVPFGYDQGDGQILFDMQSCPERLVYIPWEECSRWPLEPYHVASSIEEFFEEALRLSEEFEKDPVFENYDAIPVPYARSYGLHSETEAAVALDTLLGQRYERIDRFTSFLKRQTGLSVSVDCDLEALNDLQTAIFSIGGSSRIMSKEQVLMYEIARPDIAAAITKDWPVWQPSILSLEYSFDAGVLLGEVFRKQYPRAQWAVGRPPKSSVDYNRPVLVGPEPSGVEFSPIREMDESLLLSAREPLRSTQISILARDFADRMRL